MEKLFAGAARINRDDFMKQFDIGVPVDATTPGNQEAMILYHHPKSISNVSRQDIVRNSGVMPLLTVQDATINCDTLKIILTEPNHLSTMHCHCRSVGLLPYTQVYAIATGQCQDRH
jgi:hypothetical protein